MAQAGVMGQQVPCSLPPICALIPMDERCYFRETPLTDSEVRVSTEILFCPSIPSPPGPRWRCLMRRYLAIGITALIAAGFGMAGKIYAPMAYAAGAYVKDAGFAKQTFKEDRKKAPQKSTKGSAPRPVGP
jgi:hypothetical protein